MGPRGLTSLLIFYTSKYWIYIVFATIITSLLVVRYADHQATRNINEVSVKMTPYVTMYPSVEEIKDNNAFLNALGAKDRSTKLHYNWSLETKDSVAEIKDFYLDDLKSRGYSIERNTEHILYATKDPLGIKITFQQNDDGKRRISVIIHN